MDRDRRARSVTERPRAARPLPHRDGGVGRPPRGILDRLEPEDRDHTQRTHLLDATAEALHLLDQHLQGARDLGVDV